MDSVGLFKMLTGGDTVRAEKKFKDDFFFINYARLVFSTNKPPWVDEDTFAFWRRWIMINFSNKFEGDKADVAILDKLTNESELSGLLNIALKGLKRLLNRHHYSYEPSPDEVAEKYRKSANVTFAFIENMCEPDADAWISKDDLYDAFANYCNKQNLSPLGKESFGRTLKDVNNAHVKSRQRRVDGVKAWGWEGIRLTEAKEQDIDMEV
jgi:putative DNA primase/helicase